MDIESSDLENFTNSLISWFKIIAPGNNNSIISYKVIYLPINFSCLITPARACCTE